MRELQTVVEAAEEGMRVQTVLRRRFEFAPSLLSHLKFVPQSVLKNGAAVRMIDAVRAGDVLTVRLEGGTEGRLTLPTLYEDEDLVILDKPAAMAVHGIRGGRETVESRWRRDCGAPFHPVNRLDRGTSGAMVAAKSGYLHDRLRKMLHTEEFSREYLALAEGRFADEGGEIDLPLRYERGRSTVSPEGKAARTRYTVLARGEDCTLLRLHLLSGRTHQIRAHCAAVGHPLVGDALYGGGGAMARPALHAWRVRLRHPLTGEWLCVTAPLPQDMSDRLHAEGIAEEWKEKNR